MDVGENAFNFQREGEIFRKVQKYHSLYSTEVPDKARSMKHKIEVLWHLAIA